MLINKFTKIKDENNEKRKNLINSLKSESQHTTQSVSSNNNAILQFKTCIKISANLEKQIEKPTLMKRKHEETIFVLESDLSLNMNDFDSIFDSLTVVNSFKKVDIKR